MRWSALALALGLAGGILGAAAVSAGTALLLSHRAAAEPHGKLAQTLRSYKLLAWLAPVPSDGYEQHRDHDLRKCNPLVRQWLKLKPFKRSALIFVLICVTWYLVGFFEHSAALSFDDGVALPVAKGAGYLLDFLLTALLFPVMKNLVSWLRTTPLRDVLPLDDHQKLHILLAKLIVLASVVHIVAHYFKLRKRRDWARDAYGSRSGFTGHLVLILMVAIYATAFARKGFKIGKFSFGGFDAFWLTHQLYLLCYALLILHCDNFYRWAFWPLLLFAMDKAIHFLRGKRRVRLESVQQEERGTDVMSLYMKVEDDDSEQGHEFSFKAGQYLLLNCPQISKFEWHPFTITSAPEEEFVSVHIRTRGDWTKHLQRLLNPDSLRTVHFGQTAKGAGDAAETGTAPDSAALNRPFAPSGSGQSEGKFATMKRKLSPGKKLKAPPEDAMEAEELEITIGSTRSLGTYEAPGSAPIPGTRLLPTLRIDGPYVLAFAMNSLACAKSLTMFCFAGTALAAIGHTSSKQSC